MEPADNGSDIAAISYSITLQGGPGAATRAESSTSTTFTGLVVPNTYTVQVTAINCAGSSPSVTASVVIQGNLRGHV